MDIGKRLSFDGNEFVDDNGLKRTFEISFGPEKTPVNEKQLDDSLWHNPEASFALIKELLKDTQHQLTPRTNRLVLKALTIPAFSREFQGEDVTAQTQESVLDMGAIGSGILNRYLGLRSDRGVTQLQHLMQQEILDTDAFQQLQQETALLDQAINDLTVLQLVNRSLHADETDDIILLPVSPPKYNRLQSADFTVLRRQQLGRAHLVVAETMPPHSDISVDDQRILIKPSELIDQNGSMNQLAEILVDEYHFEEGLEDSDYATIQTATDRLFATINAHFDHIQPRS